MLNSESRVGSVGLFAHQDVGYDIVNYLLNHNLKDVSYVVTQDENEITDLCKSFQCRTIIAEKINKNNAQQLLGGVDLMILAWWPTILPKTIIEIPRRGVVNFHPSLLPYNRGKHYNFWTIVEDTPFGVSLHLVNEAIDQGDILFQESIVKSWEDNGASLYQKAKKTIIAMFKQRYEDLIAGNYTVRKQELEKGSFHAARELERASEIFLDKCYRGDELLNLLRARTFPGHPSCYFYDQGRKYEVRIAIKEVKKNEYD